MNTNECFSRVHTMTADQCNYYGGCQVPSEHHTFVEVPAILNLDGLFLGDSIQFRDDVDNTGAISIMAHDGAASKSQTIVYITKSEARRLRDWLNVRA